MDASSPTDRNRATVVIRRIRRKTITTALCTRFYPETVGLGEIAGFEQYARGLGAVPPAESRGQNSLVRGSRVETPRS